MPRINRRRTKHGRIEGHRRVGIDQAGHDRVFFDEVVAEDDLGHRDRILGPLRVGHRPHERLVAVLDMTVDHVEVTFVDRDIHRLTDRAARVVHTRAHVGELDEILEVFEGCVAPSIVEIAHERRAVSRHQHGPVTADHDIAFGVPCMLGVF